MARYPYQSFIQDGNGRAIESVTVTVYLADTTTGATIYAAKSGGSAITGSYVTTSASGYFLFYVDGDDYTEEQLFDIVPAKSGYTLDTIQDIIIRGVTGYQPVDQALTDISGLAVTDGNIIVGDGTNWVAESGATARTSLGAQTLHANLTALSGLTFAANQIHYETGAGALAQASLTAFARTILDDADAATARATIGSPLGYLSGLEISHAADTAHDITVAAGKARDATDAVDQVLASAITKRFDAEFVVGSTNGGFAEGESLPASGTIHLWLIKRSDTGVVDVMANNHATTGLTPTLPANYDYKRRIFSLRTDSSNNIINGDQWGTGIRRRFMYDSPTLDVDADNPGTSAVLVALPVPAGIKTIAYLHITIGAFSFVYLSSPDNTDLVASGTAAPLANSTGNATSGQNHVVTNTSSQIRYRCVASAGGEKMKIVTLGWEDSL